MNRIESQNAEQPEPAIMLLPSGSEIVFNGHRIVVPCEVELPYRSCEPIAQGKAAPTVPRGGADIQVSVSVSPFGYGLMAAAAEYDGHATVEEWACKNLAADANTLFQCLDEDDMERLILTGSPFAKEGEA